MKNAMAAGLTAADIRALPLTPQTSTPTTPMADAGASTLEAEKHDPAPKDVEGLKEVSDSLRSDRASSTTNVYVSKPSHLKASRIPARLKVPRLRNSQSCVITSLTSLPR
jgi:hypothetical protein